MTEINVLNDHPISMLVSVVRMEEAKAGQRVMKGRMERMLLRAAGKQEPEDFKQDMKGGVKYSLYMQENVLKFVDNECDTCMAAHRQMSEHDFAEVLEDPDNTKNLDQIKEDAKIAVHNSLFHSVRTHIKYFWTFGSTQISTANTPEQTAAVICDLLDLQLLMLEKVHEAFTVINPEDLPEFVKIKAEFEERKDYIRKVLSETQSEMAESECDCPACTEAKEEVANKPLAQTVH